MLSVGFLHFFVCLHQAGRLLIRKLVCEKMGFAWDGFRLERTARGKPFLPRTSSTPGVTHWNFNVSHQGDYAVLAAEPGGQVGVDVMKTSRPGSSSVQEFFRIMNRQFTYLEWMNIRKAGSDWDQLDMFYRHWALKESFIKAIGTGLGFDLQRVEFHISPNQMREGQVYPQTQMYLDNEVEHWTFEHTGSSSQAMRQPDMCVCVCFSWSLCLSERVNVTQITDASRFLDRAHVLHSSGLFISQLRKKRLFSIFSSRNQKTGKKRPNCDVKTEQLERKSEICICI
uniref:L-aminoadipate-semialdehyde dehydrogenase-phosphopantetheinyl transferase n=1 Tax=Sinocyclocheilus rhinocerous TaxID=307959 RepID=A0A673KXP0_9TELE